MGKERKREREKEQLVLKVTHTVWTHFISRATNALRTVHLKKGKGWISCEGWKGGGGEGVIYSPHSLLFWLALLESSSSGWGDVQQKGFPDRVKFSSCRTSDSRAKRHNKATLFFVSFLSFFPLPSSLSPIAVSMVDSVCHSPLNQIKSM